MSDTVRPDTFCGRLEEQPTTEKPWGREVLVNHNSRYALKDIWLNTGTRTSLQSHNKKHETIFVLDGVIELELVDSQGESQRTVYKPGEAYTIPPGTKHRVTVLENARVIEASTPELDDVIRHQDDFGRS